MQARLSPIVETFPHPNYPRSETKFMPPATCTGKTKHWPSGEMAAATGQAGGDWLTSICWALSALWLHLFWFLPLGPIYTKPGQCESIKQLYTEIVLLTDGQKCYVGFRHVVWSVACLSGYQNVCQIKRVYKRRDTPHHVTETDGPYMAIRQKYNLRTVCHEIVDSYVQEAVIVGSVARKK